MAPRKRNDIDWIVGVAQLIGLVMALAFVDPRTRGAVAAIGNAFVGMIVIILICVFVGGVLWFTFGRKRQTQETTYRYDPAAPVTAPNRDVPQSSTPVLSTADLVGKLRAIDWFQFEKVVEVLYRKLGYQVARRGGAKADGGIDLVIEKDGQKTAVQCKHWKTWNVTVKPMREFLGALTDAGISRGIFVMLGGYTGDAKLLADKHNIQIINESDLVRLLEQTDARFDPVLIQALDDTRKYCPKCENEMVLRTARKGVDAGSQFWGCSSYPRCRFTMSA